jgi:hypothetical protein
MDTKDRHDDAGIVPASDAEVFHTFAKGAAYAALKGLGFSEADGFHGALTGAAMALSGYLAIRKDGKVTVRGAGRPRPAVLSALTGGAVAPSRAAGYHRQKGFFAPDGTLTDSGRAWIRARLEPDARTKFHTSTTMVAAFAAGFRSGGTVNVAPEGAPPRYLDFTVKVIL